MHVSYWRKKLCINNKVRELNYHNDNSTTIYDIKELSRNMLSVPHVFPSASGEAPQPRSFANFPSWLNHKGYRIKFDYKLREWFIKYLSKLLIAFIIYMHFKLEGFKCSGRCTLHCSAQNYNLKIRALPKFVVSSILLS